MPAAPVVADKTKHSVTLSWKPPEKDGGSPIKGYIIQIQDEGQSDWVRVNDPESLHPTTEYTVPSLRALKRHRFRIIAVNDIGESDPSPRTSEVLVEDIQRESTLDKIGGQALLWASSLSLTCLYSDSTVPPSISIDVMADDLLCIRAGDPIRIPATIKGRPAPKVTWDFDGKAKSHKKNKLHTLPVDSEVKPSSTELRSVRLSSRSTYSSLCVQVESTDTTSVVSIPVSLRSHSGRYTITAKNKSGQKHVNVRVIVLGRSHTTSKKDLGTFSTLSRLTFFPVALRCSWASQGPQGHRHHPLHHEVDLEAS